MNLLGIDYGKKRIGLAWVDTAMNVVLPYGVIEIERRTRSKEQLIDLIKKERIEKVIIGLPVGLDGKENEHTKSVRAFVDELRKIIDTSMELVDERFTSAEADRIGGDARRDEKAAMLLLQAYIDKAS
jgi:putative Holliday junction resolvase